MNALTVIAPYKHLGMWVFDDARVGLVQEPFVGGADTLIDLATAALSKPEEGFVLVFSASDFPGSRFRLDWRREERDGNVYYSADFQTEGWLCPALFRYFDRPPEHLFVEVRNR
jgi:hypothetical protein